MARPPGRPTKYLPETVDRLIRAISVGTPLVHACKFAGISEDTLANWRKSYSDFSDAIKNAEGQAVVGWLAKIEVAAATGNWQAAAWKLERRYPADFGRREHIEAIVTHKEYEVDIGGDASQGDEPAQPEFVN